MYRTTHFIPYRLVNQALSLQGTLSLKSVCDADNLNLTKESIACSSMWYIASLQNGIFTYMAAIWIIICRSHGALFGVQAVYYFSSASCNNCISCNRFAASCCVESNTSDWTKSAQMSSSGWANSTRAGLLLITVICCYNHRDNEKYDSFWWQWHLHLKLLATTLDIADTIGNTVLLSKSPSSDGAIHKHILHTILCDGCTIMTKKDELRSNSLTMHLFDCQFIFGRLGEMEAYSLSNERSIMPSTTLVCRGAR